MYYNYYQTNQPGYEECLSKGICSVNPALTSLQEVILLYLKELAFYLLKLKDLGIDNKQIKNDIIDALSDIIADVSYDQEHFQDVTSRLFDDLSQAKTLYMNLCQKHNMEFQALKTYFRPSKKYSLSEAIKKGEKYFLKKTSLYKPMQKNLFDIMLFLVKSVCINIIDLKSFDVESNEAYHAILSVLNAMNFYDISEQDALQQIESFIKIYYNIINTLHGTKVSIYGEVTPTEVSFSIRPGKAILVSGSDLKDLELVLKASKDKNIDVYTHGIEMLMGHTLPKLKAYPNLIGHYGGSPENTLIDFASFPGAILMTRHSMQRVEYLYRGRLYTTDAISPRGVARIRDNNFEPLINSALDARGFTKAQQKPPMKVGYNEEEIMKTTNQIVDKIEKNEIRHIYFIGLLNYAMNQKHYFDKFMNLIPDDCFAFSLSYDKQAKNIMHIDSFYDFTLFYKILNEISNRIALDKINISVFLTKCDKHTISNVLNLKSMGIRDIYMCKCPPTLVNPTLIEALKDIFNIKDFSTPEEDIKRTLAEEI